MVSEKAQEQKEFLSATESDCEIVEKFLNYNSTQISYRKFSTAMKNESFDWNDDFPHRILQFHNRNKRRTIEKHLELQ